MAFARAWMIQQIIFGLSLKLSSVSAITHEKNTENEGAYIPHLCDESYYRRNFDLGKENETHQYS